MQPAPDAPSLADGRYTLTRRLGEGGMAAVFLGWDNKLKVWRALKVLLPHLARHTKLRKRFEIEAQAMAKLEHPNIVRVYDVALEGEVPYMVMELAEGGCIVDWLARYGAMPPRLAVDVTVQICKGIRAAHEAGIVHRDIKPHNVLVNRRAVCKVTDFGIAQVTNVDSGTKTGSVMGTWGFMAPEQRTDAKAVDERADVFSIGATLYTLLTNRTPTELYVAEPGDPIFDGIPPELLEVVVRACKYKPAERYPNVKTLAMDVYKAGQSQPSVAAPSLVLATDPLPDSVEVAPLSPTVVDELKRALGRDGEATDPERPARPPSGRTPPDAPTPAGKVDRKVLPYYMPAARPPKVERPADALPSYIDEAEYQKDERARTPAPARPAPAAPPPASPASAAPAPAASPAVDLALKLSVVPLVAVFGLLVLVAIGVAQVNGAQDRALDAQGDLVELLAEQNDVVDALQEAGADRQALVDRFYAVADAPPAARPAAALAYVAAVEAEMLEHSGHSALGRVRPRLDALLARRDAVLAAHASWREAARSLPGSAAVAVGLSSAPSPMPAPPSPAGGPE